MDKRMKTTPVKNFTEIDSIYGKFIVNRNCSYQADALIKTGVPHIQEELDKMFVIVDALPKECVILDVGANIGLVGVPLAHAVKDKKGVVYAFEVQKMLYYALCGTVALNDLDNLHVFNYGLGAEESTLSVPVPDYSKAEDYGEVSLVMTRILDKYNNFESVDIYTIDGLELQRLDFIKIDVEGMEIEVLKGGADTIKKYRPWCWIEQWNVDKKTLISQFDDLDYTIYQMDGANILCCPNEKLKALGTTINAPLFR
jgi:FkbM family methyltransferase